MCSHKAYASCLERLQQHYTDEVSVHRLTSYYLCTIYCLQFMPDISLDKTQEVATMMSGISFETYWHDHIN